MVHKTVGGPLSAAPPILCLSMKHPGMSDLMKITEPSEPNVKVQMGNSTQPLLTSVCISEAATVCLCKPIHSSQRYAHR